MGKLNTLKYGNNAEIMETWFSMKFEARKYFFQELKYFFSIGVSHTVALLSLLLLKFENVSKKFIKKTWLLYKIVFFPNRGKNLSPFRTKVPIRFHALRNLETCAARNRKKKQKRNREIIKLVRKLVSSRLNININIRGYKYPIKSIHNCS